MPVHSKKFQPAIENRLRSVNVRIDLIRWSWSAVTAGKRDANPIDITSACTSYRFSKSINNPQGNAQIGMLPQETSINILDLVETMDVVRIYEFDTLKYQGYVSHVSYTGMINARDGKPTREAIINLIEIGGLLVESSIGLGLGRVLGSVDAFFNAAAILNTNIQNATSTQSTYIGLLNIFIDSWFQFINTIGQGTFTTFINEYFSRNGLIDNKTTVFPREFDLYTGQEESISFWDIAEKLAEKPLNELWIDNGPRYVEFGAGSTTAPKLLLPEEKSYIIMRDTPFNGTVKNGVESAHFTGLNPVKLDLDHLVRFDLSKSMREAYSVFGAIPSAFAMNDNARQLYGYVESDSERLNKYLYKPLVSRLFYSRLEANNSTATEGTSAGLSNYVKDIADTLKNWYVNNDKYYSGAITHMVPKNNNVDPRIGDKLEVESIPGAFYVEGVSHSWTYGGPITSNLTVTRGWDYTNDKQMVFSDRVFKRSIVQ